MNTTPQQERPAPPAWYSASCLGVFEGLPDGIAIVSRDGSFLYCNAACRSILGMTTAQILGDEPLAEGVWPVDADGQRLERECLPSKEVFRTGEPRIAHVMGIHREREWPIWITVNAIPIPGPDGADNGGCLLTIRDTTAVRLVESQLRRHAEMFRRTSDGIVIIDRDARVSEWSDGAQRLFGYTTEEIVGCYAWLLHENNTLEPRLREMREHLRERRDWKGEMNFRRKDGSMGVAEVELFPVVGAENRLQEVQIIYHDVTAQRNATEEARLRARYLEALADLATRLLDSGDQRAALSAAVAILGNASGASRCYLFENSFGERGEWYMTQAAEWCAPEVRSFLNDPDLQNLPYEPDLASLKLDFERGEPHSALVRNEPDAFRQLLEMQDIRAILLIPIMTHRGCLGFVGFDNCESEELWSREQVTLLHAAASALAQAFDRWSSDGDRARLEEQLRQSYKMEAMGRMSGGIAHDFNNILAAILGYVHDLEESFTSNDEALHGLDEIRKAARRGARLVDQLLTFARRQVVERRVLDLNAVVADLIPMLQKLSGTGIEFEVHMEQELWPVLADAGQMEQVLTNLCLNSRDAMDGRGRIKIVTENLTLRREALPKDFPLPPGEHVLLTVSDQGPGLPPDAIEKIFEPFFTTKEQGKGTGVGLAVVYGIVKGGGGHIDASNLEDGGCSFRVLLPRAGAADSPSGAGDAGEKDQGVVMVFEEDGALRQSVGTLLHQHGFTAFLGGGMPDAADLLDDVSDPPDLLVLGIGPETKSLMHLVEAARARFPDVPIIYLCNEPEADGVDFTDPFCVVLPSPPRAADLIQTARRLSVKRLR